ncbi:MAG: subclass B1 metallo-beta-lactamase [Maribacter sp.]|nr:subclass B1 metallo-beta-lactamase [Maribacter sp.]MBT8315441.1 subclass B1 metallo-beta-lactamase [Maribacter sp.]
MQLLKIIPIYLLVLLVACRSKKNNSNPEYGSDNLKIERLTKNVYVHISYLKTESYGKVPCNGMIVLSDDEAIIIDTPANDVASDELLNWLEDRVAYKIKAIVATHFHTDCLGGLNAFHQRNIPSYALNKTRTLAGAKGETIPQNGFETNLELKVGRELVISGFFGEGHTKDNIVCYIPSEKVLFGGCLIKSEGAGKGNLNDANINEWSNTVRNLKTEYSEAKLVIPGHGRPSDANLFDYTINLFNQD